MPDHQARVGTGQLKIAAAMHESRTGKGDLAFLTYASPI